MPYTVALDAFHGPLDLLLYLVKKHEVDVRDIPIAPIAQQFLDYLTVLQVADVELAGDFLVMAATLMEIKSKMLLPQAVEPEADEADPRRELVKQLVEYKKFKEVAARLEGRAAEQQRRLPRQPVAEPTGPAGPPPMQPVELWDLVSAFGRLLRETLALQPQQISVDQTPLHVYMDEVLGQLSESDRLPLSRLFRPPYTRSRLVGYLLAILELTRRFTILAEQDEIFGDIWVWLAPPAGLPG
jgi:segregation and condensation protein A